MKKQIIGLAIVLVSCTDGVASIDQPEGSQPSSDADSPSETSTAEIAEAQPVLVGFRCADKGIGGLDDWKNTEGFETRDAAHADWAAAVQEAGFLDLSDYIEQANSIGSLYSYHDKTTGELIARIPIVEGADGRFLVGGTVRCASGS